MGLLDTIDKIENKDNDQNNTSHNPNDIGTRNVNINNDDFYYSKDMENISVRSIRPKTFLYTTTIKKFLGEKAEAIAKILISKQRITLKALYSYLNTTDVPMDLSSIKKTLVSMIQLNLIKYYQDEIPRNFNPKLNNNKKFKQKIHYSLNDEGINVLLYSGEIITASTSYHSYMGKPAMLLIEQIMTNCLQFGFLSIDQIIMTVKNSEHTEFPEFGDEEFIKQCIDILIKDGWLSKTTPLDQCPPRDLWALVYNREYYNIGQVDKTLSELKRKHQSVLKSKEKFNVLTSFSQGDVLKISLDRLWKYKRVMHIAKLSESIHGIHIAKILSFCGDIVGNKQPSLRDPLKQCGLFDDANEKTAFIEESQYKDENTKGCSFDALDIQRFIKQRKIPINLNNVLINTLVEKNNQNPNKRVKRENPSLNDIQEENEDDLDIDLDLDSNGKRSIKDEDDDDEFDINTRASIPEINACLQLLSDDMQSIQFLRKTATGRYYFPFTELNSIIKQNVYDGLIESSLGVSSLRLLRCVRANRLVTEKTLCSLVLLKDKDVRHIVTKLIKINAVEIQELPKASDRSAARTVFLYRIDETHQYQYMEDNLCWNIANLINKVELLKEKNKVLLAKAEREDVVGNEEELLLASELSQLKMINEREISSYVRLNRLLCLWEVFQF